MSTLTARPRVSGIRGGLHRSVQGLQHGVMMNNSRLKSGAQGSLDNGGQAR
jgi:hypothetical protein